MEVNQCRFAALGEAGSRYLQFDEVPLAMLCDPLIREQVRLLMPAQRAAAGGRSAGCARATATAGASAGFRKQRASARQRIAGLEGRVARKVAVRGPELGHAVIEADCGNARVVDRSALDPGPERQGL